MKIAKKNRSYVVVRSVFAFFHREPTVWTTASFVWRKVLASRATPILILLCLGGLAFLVLNPDIGVLDRTEKVVGQTSLVISVLAILAVLFLGGTEIALELQDRTAMFWLSHPIARWRYVLGKMLGSCIVGWSLLVLLGGVATILFRMRGVVPDGSFVNALATDILRVLILSSLLTFLSTSMSYMQATFIGGVLCLMGFASYALPLYASLMGLSPASGLFWGIYGLIPNWEHFGFGMDIAMASGTMIFMTFWMFLAVYSLAYTAFFTILAILAFQWKDIP